MMDGGWCDSMQDGRQGCRCAYAPLHLAPCFLSLLAGALEQVQEEQ